MERAEAIKKLVKLLGKNAGWRVDNKAPKQEERDAAKVELVAALDKRNRLKVARDVRYEMILAADAEYQRLHAEHKTAQDRVNELSSKTRHYKMTVGTNEGLFFLIKAEGDSWEEIFDKLKTKQVA